MFGVAVAGLVASIASAFAIVSRADVDPHPDYRVATASKPLPPPFLLFRTLGPPRAYGRIAMLPLRGTETRYLTSLRCSRVAYAGGRGLCLIEEATGDMVTHVAEIFDRSFERQGRLVLAGVPTRVRVSPDGRFGAVTTYAEEESPAGERLAIESVVIDLKSATVLADLRDFRLETDDADAFVGPFDFASVSFDRDSDRFFATLSTATNRSVVVGSVRQQTLRPLKAGLASEAISPDGARLVVKQRVNDRGFWQVAILDLASLREQPLLQGDRSIDDQVEWLDENNVVYHDAREEGTGLWVLAADGRSGPRLLLPEAFSPAVVR